MNPRFRDGLRFHRDSGSAFRDARYGASIEIHTRPSLWRRIWTAIVGWL